MESQLEIIDGLKLKWTIKNDGTFDMQVDYNKQNWVGFGFCPTMEECDMFSIEIEEKQPNALTLIDRFSEEYEDPEEDDTQNLMSIA